MDAPLSSPRGAATKAESLAASPSKLLVAAAAAQAADVRPPAPRGDQAARRQQPAGADQRRGGATAERPSWADARAEDADRDLAAAAEVLRAAPRSMSAHSRHAAALLQRLTYQLRRAELARARAAPDEGAAAEVAASRSALQAQLEAALALALGRGGGGGSPDEAPAEGDDSVTFRGLCSDASMLSAMRFCKFFASPAAVATLAAAAAQQQQCPAPGAAGRKQPPPFTLVVDPQGAGHAASLAEALELVAAAVADGARQQYSGAGRQRQQSPASGAGGGWRWRWRSPAASASSSAPATEHVTVLLLPGTYSGRHCIPSGAKRVTIAALPPAVTGGARALLCAKEQPDTAAAAAGVQQQQRQQEERHPGRDASSLASAFGRLLRLWPAAAAAPAAGSAAAAACGRLQHERQGCLVACADDTRLLRLQHLSLRGTPPVDGGRGGGCVSAGGAELRLEGCEFFQP